ncbi:MAG: hypothetical protein M1305_00410 [Candidatus Marsarchaeota archaeon]|nr:hypothetical protein [Candidatus Marsarchaeota archaeon]
MAAVIELTTHKGISSQMTMFDGQWYLKVVQLGYPNHVVEGQSTLGFFPLYPLAIWLVSSWFGVGRVMSAIGISMVGGLAATLLLFRLALSWWGESCAFKAVVVFCLFPGSVVFSMAYSEGLLIPLSLGCLLALSRDRWLAAGVLAGLSTAVGPLAIPIIIVCSVAAIRNLLKNGWLRGVNSLFAPVLSVTGITAFGIYLWKRTGTPLAAYLAQKSGWHEQLDPVAAFNQSAARNVLSNSHLFVTGLLSWNLLNGVSGAIFLLVSVILLLRARHTLSSGSLVWTIGVSLVSLASLMTAVKARIILDATPAVMVWGWHLSRRRFIAFVGIEVTLLIFGAALTYLGLMLP